MNLRFLFEVGQAVRFDGIGRGKIEQQVTYWNELHYTVKFKCSDHPHVCHQSELTAVKNTNGKAVLG